MREATRRRGIGSPWRMGCGAKRSRSCIRSEVERGGPGLGLLACWRRDGSWAVFGSCAGSWNK
ncbi:unnamed protein product [Linum tenue]|uniref:Uncharacterized protein n=1 Tax=Linum tenue TaxID=586396 RepID=A0AAV0Q8D4_9ROSI|nr:unnamed protein product [Linum tenue]